MFPLLRLPFTVHRELAKLFDPEELFLLSVCSKRAKRMVTVCHDMSRVFDIGLTANDMNTGIEIYHNKDRTWDLIEVSKTYLKIDAHPVSSTIGENSAVNYVCTDMKRGVESSLKHISDIFHIPASRKVVLAICDQERVLKWVKDKEDPNWKIIHLHIQDPNEFSPENLWETFQYLKVSETYFIVSNNFTNANFNYTYPLPKVNSLYINQGSWLTIESLLTLDSHTLRVRDSNLSNRDINRFLKHWLNGNLNRLQELLVGLKENVNFAVIFDGIAFVEAPEMTVPVDKFRENLTDPHFETLFNECRVIQQEDGKQLGVFRTHDPQHRNEIFIQKALEEADLQEEE